jgi:CDP-diacylglycerol--glycerol-3-phosphate 3-phosphatidyltransferase
MLKTVRTIANKFLKYHMSIRNSYLAILFYRFSDKYILPVLKQHLHHPNHITALGTVLAALVPFGFTVHPMLGSLMITFSAVIDVLDGHFARVFNQSSEFGAFWDSSLDRISDFFYLMGFWVLFHHSTHFILATVMINYALITTFMISYVKARAEALHKSCRKGLMDRGIWTLYLICWSLLLGSVSKNNRLLWFGLGLFCLLSTMTVIQRMLEIRSQCCPEKHPIKKSSY